jgi:hypothetical protein
MAEVRLSPQAALDRIRELMAMQRAEAAEELCRAALRVLPDAAPFRHQLGRSLMMQGRWSEGWPFMESRPVRLALGAHALPYPEWTGDALGGRSILVWGEQGLGDEIMFARFVPELRLRGASRITFACRGAHHRLFAQLKPDLLLDHMAEKVSAPRHDLWVPLASLPLHLGVTPQTLDGRPYFTASAAGGRKGGVGLVERGNPLNTVDADRSVPAGALQAAIPLGRLIEPAGDSLDSLAQLAALDLLVTVDTAWAHLAGALGLPCWLLLPFRNVDWRWLRVGETTPWYDSVRLYRQPAPGDWGAVLARVSRDAAELSP